MERSQLLKAIEEILKEKGKRKFAQSIDLAINLRDVDFKKPENRVNVDVVLPNAPRESKVAVFADGQMAVDAKKVVALVIGSEEINSYATDKRKQKELMDYTLLSQAQLMTTVGKVLGQLGHRVQHALRAFTDKQDNQHQNKGQIPPGAALHRWQGDDVARADCGQYNGGPGRPEKKAKRHPDRCALHQANYGETLENQVRQLAIKTAGND